MAIIRIVYFILSIVMFAVVLLQSSIRIMYPVCIQRYSYSPHYNNIHMNNYAKTNTKTKKERR